MWRGLRSSFFGSGLSHTTAFNQNRTLLLRLKMVKLE